MEHSEQPKPPARPRRSLTDEAEQWLFPILRRLESEGSYADLRIEVKRGGWHMLHISQSIKPGDVCS